MPALLNLCSQLTGCQQFSDKAEELAGVATLKRRRNQVCRLLEEAGAKWQKQIEQIGMDVHRRRSGSRRRLESADWPRAVSLRGYPAGQYNAAFGVAVHAVQ
jgi:hypothetical protein